MKKFTYLFVIVTILSLSFSSCTEENVAPARDKGTEGMGGGMSGDPGGNS
jgi:hypothetical protein